MYAVVGTRWGSPEASVYVSQSGGCSSSANGALARIRKRSGGRSMYEKEVEYKVQFEYIMCSLDIDVYVVQMKSIQARMA